MEQFKPIDATTNPSLILAAANQKKYAHLLDKAVQYGKKIGRFVSFYSIFLYFFKTSIGNLIV